MPVTTVFEIFKADARLGDVLKLAGVPRPKQVQARPAPLDEELSTGARRRHRRQPAHQAFGSV
jgi:hypothetical protein